MIFINIFIFKINEIILLIIVYHNFEKVEENYNTNYNSHNSLNLIINEYSYQENWFNDK